MVSCKKCKQFVSSHKDDTVKCKGACESVFHTKCVKNLKKFLQKEICEECQKAEGSPKQQTPGSSSSAHKIVVNPSETSGEKVLLEVNKKLEVLYKMEKKLQDLTDTVDFYAEGYQKMTEFKGEAEKRIKALEQKNIYLEKYNKALEERVQELELRDKEKKIEIHGLETQGREDTVTVVKAIARKLKLNPDDIVEVQRVGQEKKEDPRPNIISVTLATRSARNMWLSAKKEHKIKNSEISTGGSEKNIFIVEDLPKYKRQLLWLVRSQLKQKGFQYIWVQNSNILVKKNSEEKKIYNIKSEKDLERFNETHTA